jgi:diguanylate cyclase
MSVDQFVGRITRDVLQQAIKQNDLTLVYQPIVSAQSARTVAVEALARLKLPSGDLVSPDEFIELAESTGLVCDLGEWALRRACQDGLNWPGVRVAVNISPKQLQFPNFLNTVRRILKETGFPPQRLEFELTEHSPVEDVASAHAILAGLRKIGVCLSLDDFGVGYSGLIALRRLPVDKIKIDRAFVESMGSRKADALVRSIVRLGRDLGLTVTAEGVETAEHQKFLADAGCDELQGYFFARPLPASDIDTLRGCGAGAPQLRVAGAA